MNNALCFHLHFHICALNGSWALNKSVDKYNPKASLLGSSAPFPNLPTHPLEKVNHSYIQNNVVFFFSMKINGCLLLLFSGTKTSLGRGCCKKFSFRAQITTFFQGVCHLLLGWGTSGCCFQQNKLFCPKHASQLSGFIPLGFCFEHIKCQWGSF